MTSDSENPSVDHFIKRVNEVINYMRREYDMNYAEVIGSLEIVKAEIFKEMEEIHKSEENGE